MNMLRGTAVSPGYANGTVVVYRPRILDSVERSPIYAADVEKEFKRFKTAAEHAMAEVAVVREQVAADVGESEAAIFDAHSAMLGDPTLMEHVRERLEQDLICAEAALADEIEGFARLLAVSGNDYTRELAMDAQDVGKRLLRHLCQDEFLSPLANLPPESVIFARDLMPSETVGMDRKNVSGIATERGGATSHAAILARSLGIPAVTGLSGLMDSAVPDSVCLLDGVKGRVVLDPSDAQSERFAQRHRSYDHSRALMRLMENKTSQLQDGTRIKLMANINQGSDVDLAEEHNLDGIGLYRTELMYLSAHSAPGLAIQTRHYCRAAAACGEHPVTIRTFDFAADKHPSFLSINSAASHDLRGLQFALHQPRLFKTQLRAIVRAAKEFPNIRILLPMVSGWWELKEVLKIIKDLSEEEQLRHRLPIGAMIETPAAIFTLPEIIELVDFISIGCNDLAQYTLAVDRERTTHTVAECALHPALLRAIRQIIDTANHAGCPVCVCGEAASDPVIAAVLVGLGMRELSVSPARAPVIRYALRHLNLTDAEAAAACALNADPFSAMDELLAAMPWELGPILAMESGG